MKSRDREDSVTLEILESIDAKSDVTQRHLARRTGIALGLANSYLKRCVRKGLIKVQQTPANRYLYYLTPKGFAEKSRLTAHYLSDSFEFYRRAGQSCAEVFEECKRKGWNRITMCGASDLAEIASLRALEHDIEIVFVYEPGGLQKKFLNHHVVGSIEASRSSDGWMLTDLTDPQMAYDRLVTQLPADRIIVPEILGVKKIAARELSP